MGVLSEFTSLASRVKQPLALSDDAFLVFDFEASVKKLRLDQKAAENGASNNPKESSENLDEVELEITSSASEYLKRAQIDSKNNFSIYEERLSHLGLLSRLSDIQVTAQRSQSDFKAEVKKVKDRLENSRDAIESSYKELEEFKRLNKLNRPARPRKGFLVVGAALITALLIEGALNTFFLRVNDNLGILGGFLAALIVAAVNIGGSAFAGKFVWPLNSFHGSKKRFLGHLLTLLWAVLLLFWNLLAAHFREAKASGINSPEIEAVRLLFSDPFVLESVYSIGIFIVGIVFGFLAAWGVYKADDPYPGFGELQQNHDDRCQEYADDVAEAIEDLTDIRDDAIEEAQEVCTNLEAQLQERMRIVNYRQRLCSRLVSYDKEIEEVTNRLLTHYRAINEEKRSTPAPPHFQLKWTASFALKDLCDPEWTKRDNMEDRVKAAEDCLNASMSGIINSYDTAVEGFVPLAELKKELSDG